MASTVGGGLLADRMSKKSKQANAKVIMIGNTIAVPLLAISVFTRNFWVSVASGMLTILCSGAHSGPAITMIQNAAGRDKTAIAYSAYNFAGSVGHVMVPMILSFFANRFGAVTNPRIYGYLILAFTSLGYLGSNIFYYKGGKAYEKM